MDYRKLTKAWEEAGLHARNPYKFDNTDKDYGQRVHINDTADLFTKEAPGWEESIGRRASRAEGRGKDWDLGTGWGGAEELFKARDWEKARKAMQRQAETVVPSYYTESPSLTAGPVGMRPNIPAIVANDMDFMWGMQDQPVKPVISLVVNGAYYCGMNCNYAIPWAVALLRWIDGAAVRGYSVALSMVFQAMCGYGDDNGEVYEFELVIKEPQESLQLGLIATGFHPATFRRVFFTWLECYGTPKQQKKRGDAVGGGYGQAGSRVQGKHPLELCVPSLDSQYNGQPLARERDNWDEALETLRLILKPQLEEGGLGGLAVRHDS